MTRSNRCRGFAALALCVLALVGPARPLRAQEDPDAEVMRRAQELANRDRAGACALLEKHLAEHKDAKRRGELRWLLAMLYEQGNEREKEEPLLRAIVAEDGSLADQAGWRLMHLLEFSFYLYSDRTWGTGETPLIALNLWRNDGGKGRERPPIPFELYRCDAKKLEADLTREPRALETLIGSPPAGSLEKLDAWTEGWPEPGSGRSEPVKLAKATKAGIYVLVAKPHGITFRIPVIVAPHALVVKRAADRAVVFAARRADGAPIAGLALETFREQDGKLARVALGKTDAQGIWDGSVPENALVFAWSDGSIAASNAWWWNGGGGFTTHFSTDRPIYHPGQTVHWKAIVRRVGPGGEHLLPEKDQVFSAVIRDANGAEVWKGEKKANEFGTFSGELELPPTASLGTYSVDLGTGFWGELRVEEYRKPEYSVTVTAPAHVVQGESFEAKVLAKYYFGQPVAKAKVTWEVFRRPHWRPWWVCFPTAYDWFWDDEDENPYRGWYGPGESFAQGEAELAADGTTSIKANVPVREGQFQDEVVTVVARVVDASRREESGTAEVLAPRAAFSLNLQQERWVYRPGDEVVLQVKALDPENKPRAGVALVAVARVRTWKEGQGWVGTEKEVAKAEATTDAAGSAALRFSADARGSLEVVVTARDEKGREVRATASFWLADELWASPTRAGIELVTDKKSYRPGDKATILCSMPQEKGTALVSREREGIVAYKVERWEKGSLLLKLDLDEADAPNVYVSVTAVAGQLHHGVASLAVPPDKKLLDVTVSFDKATYRPKEKALVTVRATEKATGKPARAEVALGVVDASIYALAADPAPDLRKHFHRKRPLLVQTMSSFEWYVGGRAGGDKLLAGASSESAPAPAAARGPAPKKEGKADDADSSSLAQAEVRTEFPDTWVWRGHLVTDERGEARIELVVPDSLTTWRATARAVTSETQVGNATAESNVFLPVLVRAEPPRFLVQGDRGGISALAHNYLEAPKKMKLSWTATGITLGKATVTGAVVTKLEDASAWVEVPPRGEVHVDWFEAAAERPGLAALELTAQTDEASDAVRTKPFPVLAHGAPRFEGWAGQLDEREEHVLELRLPEGAIPEATQVEVSLAPSVAATMLDTLEFLAGYPYGCVEQTMSRFLPDVVALEALRKSGANDPKLRAELPKMIKAGLDRLRGFQHPDGGWGWWEHDQTHPYMTAYVVYGLALARQADVAVPDDVLARGVVATRRLLATKARAAHGPDKEDPNARAYMLLALAVAGSPADEQAAQLFEARGQLNHYGRAVLARALALGKKPDRARKLAGELVAAAKQTGGLAWWDVPADECGWTRLDTETTAQALHALEEVGEGKDLWPKIIRWLVAHRKGRQWYSTKDTAMIVYALAEHLGRSGELEADEDLSIRVGDREVWKGHADRGSVLTLRGTVKLGAADLAGAKTIAVRRSGKGTAYWAVSLRTVAFGEDLKASAGAVSIKRSYEVVRRDAKGNATRGPLGKEPLAVGDELHVTLELGTVAAREYLLIEDPIPAGCEFVRDDLGGEGHGAPARDWSYWYAHREYRDDRLAICATTLWPTAKNEVRYVLRCERPGSYHVMPTRATDMYLPDVGGTGDEARLTIR